MKKSKIKFYSKKEAKHYSQLKQRKIDGEIKYILRGVPFDLGKYGTYVCDFLIVWADDSVSFEDIKAPLNQSLAMDKNMAELLYDVEIKQIDK